VPNEQPIIFIKLRGFIFLMKPEWVLRNNLLPNMIESWFMMPDSVMPGLSFFHCFKKLPDCPLLIPFSETFTGLAIAAFVPGSLLLIK